MASTILRQVNKQGQISIGKKYAGKRLCVHEYPDGTIVLRPAKIVSEFELRLLRDRTFHARLDAFDQWESENRPVETDLALLEKELEA